MASTVILVWESETRGTGSSAYESRGKLSVEQVLALMKHVDDTHTNGGTVTNRRLPPTFQTLVNVAGSIFLVLQSSLSTM